MAFCSVLNNNNMMPASKSEIEQIYRKLEQGTDLLKLYLNKKPERRTFCIKLETRQIIMLRPIAGRSVLEGTVDLREVKEVRMGKNSKPFERWPDDTRKYQNNECFTIIYGNTFKLKLLSCVAKKDECDLWVKGVRHLSAESSSAPYPLLVERWLRKEFYSMESLRGVITIKDLKAFLPKINLKLPTNRLKEFFQDADTRRVGEIGFEGFASLYHNLIHDEQLFCSTFGQYTTDGQRVTLQEFKQFLLEQQKDSDASDEEKVSKIMREYLEDPSRDAQEPFFTVPEFLDFLFSKHNHAWESKHDLINQDMTQPLVNYWIASSHNTYLTGDQVKSESSTEAYARCLRMGCRCIELDCWDGPDGMPHVFHGHTLTSKIKFLDVIKTIKEHAFVASEYPVILSLENHCTLPQQRNMASAFLEIFGDLLLTQPVERDGMQMPSPAQLKRKIIIKHKKLPEGHEERIVVRNDEGAESDISNAIKNGILYLEDPVDHEWRPHFFMLTQNKMYYAEEEESRDEDDDNEDTSTQPREGVPSNELHFGEKWFHGKLSGGRTQAQELLNQYSFLGDGTFLVRESETFVGDYSLSFWRQGTVNHCRIRSRQERGQTKYYLIDTISFDTLYSLITYYQSNQLRSPEFCMCLTEPVPQPNKHEGKEWYHANMTRAQAEDMLKRVHYDGAFLVRPSEKEANCFAISFRAENKIKHCRIKLEGRLFTIGTAQFESLVELVNYYEKHTLYRKVKLKYPVNEEVVRRIGGEPEYSPVYGPPGMYMDPNCFISKITVKALYDYRATRVDELSFCKHAIITNVVKESGGWWKGDYGGKKQHWFPANYVEEIEPQENGDENSVEAMPLGSLQKGSIDIVNCTVDILTSSNRGREFVFRIVSPRQVTPIEIAAGSREEMAEWIQKIRETAQSANDMLLHSKKMERTLRIAKELSKLIVYCRSMPFSPEKIGNFTEMSSFPETKIEKWVSAANSKFLLKYHRLQFSRVYPKGSRIDSSNYDPMKCWNSGVQMVALNYQTPDRAMQLNQARFLQNGRCGYVLRPECMFEDHFDPHDRSCVEGREPFMLSVQVIAARHLMKTSKGIVSPFIELEVLGSEFDTARYKTTTKEDNGLNPVWKETFSWSIYSPELALIKFTVQYEDMFGDPNFLAQACYPVTCLRSGYRSIPLKNEFSEELELACLLVHIELQNPHQPELNSFQQLNSIAGPSDQSRALTFQLDRSEDSSS
ncbi:1-phosphatidylinositol 4,5-bisphosphate phosphodiesterase gamma-1 isoform X2 [Parasteatoda tepidariorum]|uniref:1-phosphatidylinositol 4,5-bisphosphate phosphodiesterase gamma-1 isoform X2 n=1 Tax=Parasteatoda tepidariorum TaxID=114398 RepID=UPI001C71A3D1|nr:1-phosphatidylinositol 4,5-bisphosphate phosphodiesterase gamma-1 isoform X2 [Parasteatoda tepidariorum]